MPAPTIHPAASDPDPRTGAVLRRAHLRDIDPVTLYLLAKLRQDVFTIEQHATEPDLDGRELEPGTTLLWIEVPAADGGALPQGQGDVVPVAQVRVLTEPDGTMRIGRLVVAAEHRKDGFGGRAMRAALDVTHELAPEADVHIDAQAYLERWYQGMGYETVGEMFLDAGIEHVPMRYRRPRE